MPWRVAALFWSRTRQSTRPGTQPTHSDEPSRTPWAICACAVGWTWRQLTDRPQRRHIGNGDPLETGMRTWQPSALSYIPERLQGCPVVPTRTLIDSLPGRHPSSTGFENGDHGSDRVKFTMRL